MTCVYIEMRILYRLLPVAFTCVAYIFVLQLFLILAPTLCWWTKIYI